MGQCCVGDNSFIFQTRVRYTVHMVSQSWISVCLSPSAIMSVSTVTSLRPPSRLRDSYLSGKISTGRNEELEEGRRKMLWLSGREKGLDGKFSRVRFWKYFKLLMRTPCSRKQSCSSEETSPMRRSAFTFSPHWVWDHVHLGCFRQWNQCPLSLLFYAVRHTKIQICSHQSKYRM